MYLSRKPASLEVPFPWSVIVIFVLCGTQAPLNGRRLCGAQCPSQGPATGSSSPTLPAAMDSRRLLLRCCTTYNLPPIHHHRHHHNQSHSRQLPTLAHNLQSYKTEFDKLTFSAPSSSQRRARILYALQDAAEPIRLELHLYCCFCHCGYCCSRRLSSEGQAGYDHRARWSLAAPRSFDF